MYRYDLTSHCEFRLERIKEAEEREEANLDDDDSDVSSRFSHEILHQSDIIRYDIHHYILTSYILSIPLFLHSSITGC